MVLPPRKKDTMFLPGQPWDLENSQFEGNLLSGIVCFFLQNCPHSSGFCSVESTQMDKWWFSTMFSVHPEKKGRSVHYYFPDGKNQLNRDLVENN